MSVTARLPYSVMLCDADHAPYVPAWEPAVATRRRMVSPAVNDPSVGVQSWYATAVLPATMLVHVDPPLVEYSILRDDCVAPSDDGV